MPPTEVKVPAIIIFPSDCTLVSYTIPLTVGAKNPGVIFPVIGSTSATLLTVEPLYEVKSPTNKILLPDLTALLTLELNHIPNIEEFAITDPGGLGGVIPAENSKARVASGLFKILNMAGVITTDHPVLLTGLPTTVAPEAARLASVMLPVSISLIGVSVGVSSTTQSLVPIVTGLRSAVSAYATGVSGESQANLLWNPSCSNIPRS